MASKRTRKSKARRPTRSLPSQDFFLNSLPGIHFFVLDVNYCYVSFSPAHAKVIKAETGISIVKGMNIIDVIPKLANKKKAKKDYDRVLNGKSFVRTEHYVPGSQQPNQLEIHYAPAKSRSGKINGIYVWIIDATSHHRAKNDANHFSALLTSSLESVNHGILVLNLERKIIFCNQQFQALFNIPKTLTTSGSDEKIMNWVLDQVETTPAFMERIQSIMDDEGAESFDRIQLKDGRIFNRLTKPHRMNETIVGRVWSFQDITTQEQFERDIRHLASFPLHYPEIIIEITRDGTLSYGNPAFYEAIRRLGLADHTPFIPHDFKALSRQQGPWKNTTEVLVKNRTFNEKIFYLPEKDLIRIYAFDLTDRLEAEKQKSNLEITYKTLFESATDAITMVDMSRDFGRIVSANPAAAVMHGYSLMEFLQLNVRDIDAGGDDQLTFTERLKNFNKDSRQHLEVRHFRKDGSVFPLEVVASLIDISGDKFMLLVARDISLRKKNEEEIKRQYKFIESLSAASPDVVYVYDVELDRYVYGNQRLADTYGYPLEELLEKGHGIMLGVLHPEDAAKIPGWIEQLSKAKDGEVIESHFRLRKADGTWRTLRSRESVFLRNARGKVKQFIGTSLDITEQLAAEEALRESENRFRALHEASFGGIAIHNMGIIVECNAGLSQISGYSYQELIGFNGLNLVHPDDRAMVLERIKAQVETPYDARGLRKDGSVYSLEVKGKAVPYQGQILRVTEFRDVTDRVKAAEKMIEQNDRLQAIAEDLKFKNEQLDEFTQIVSHNLRAPAGNIVSLSDFLMTEQTQAERDQTLELLKQSGKNILNTLAELNEVLKIKQSKNIEKRLLEFETVFVRTCQMLNAHISNMGARVERNFDEAPRMEYPHIYLESIFLNLLSNALKYSDPARVPNIRFKTYYLNERIVLEVADNGLGINLERYGHQIFKMRKTFHNHPDSRGIGLFMIKNQVEAMGGQIMVTSAEKEGTTFRIIF
jgi:PAS domain S-box-containing protein